MRDLGKRYLKTVHLKGALGQLSLQIKAVRHEKISGVRGACFGLGVFSSFSGDALNKTSLLTKWFAVSFSKLNHKHGRKGKICPLYKPVSVHSFEGVCIPAKLFDASAVECFRREERGSFEKANKTAHLKLLEKFLPAESGRLKIGSRAAL